MYVVTWDNGTGFREWASQSQPSQQAALEAAGIDEAWLGHPQLDYKIEKV